MQLTRVNSRTRRLVAIACILVLGVAAVTPSTWSAAGVLVVLPLLFGTLVSIAIPTDDSSRLETAPVVSVRSPRAPPAA